MSSGIPSFTIKSSAVWVAQDHFAEAHDRSMLAKKLALLQKSSAGELRFSIEPTRKINLSKSSTDSPSVRALVTMFEAHALASIQRRG